MSAQELRVYVPGGDEWRERTGNIQYLEGNEHLPGVSLPARRLSSHDRFEVTEIPGAMEKMGWHTSAALLNKWFHHSPKNQARSAYEKTQGHSEDMSRVYPADRLDKQTIRLDWILSYPRTSDGFKKLQGRDYLTTPPAQRALISSLYKYRQTSRIDALELSGGDVEALHNAFQFQLVRVDTTSFDKASLFLGAMLHHGKPDDLAGALGGFSMYAAVAEAKFRPALLGGIDVEVSRIAVYVKNPYSFFDDPDESGSQYLGHWNKDGICLVPEGYVAQWAKFGGWSNYAIRPEGPYGRTFWPVHNSDFRRWQDTHNAGGDMVLFSDCRIVKIEPIRFRVKR